MYNENCLLMVVLYETGHALAVSNYTDNTSIMFAYYN